MNITMDMIKEFREATGAGVMDAKAILTEASGDMSKAIELMRKKGEKIALKKKDRQASEGVIGHYVHSNGKVAALVELACETDFVARNDAFKNLAHELAMQVAAANPSYVSSSDVPEEVKMKEKEIYKEQLKNEGKPEAMLEKIAEGKLQKFYEEMCLLNQPFFKDEKKTVQDLITDAVTQMGENIHINRFVRFSM